MVHMPNMTTRRTDKEVLEVINAAVNKDQVLSMDAIANQLDCCELTVLRAIQRLEALGRIEVNRDQKPNRYRIVQ